MTKIFESEYKKLRQYMICLIDILIEDEEYKQKWYYKIDILDKNIDRKRKQQNLNRRFNGKRYKRMEINKHKNELDFS
jgi:hypothetical protein